MMSPDTNVTLVHRLFVQNMMAIRGFAIALLPDFNKVDDVVQETFITATAKAANFKEGTNFKAWIFAIVRLKVLESLRTPGSQAAAFKPDVIEALCATEECEPVFEEHLQILNQCLGCLAPQARRAIDLRYQQAHGPMEIARIMGWSVNAVNVALARARVALRACIESNLNKTFIQPHGP
jgi:RNA polymerase sigma-70 factor (ECF subfamily)